MFGFVNESYHVTEGGSYNNVTVGVLSGELGREVVVVLDTLSATAEGNELYPVIMTITRSLLYMPIRGRRL